MIANLMEKKWLWRTFHVVTGEGVFEVVYNGKGTGFEEIRVNGEIARRTVSWWWYVPKFDFVLGNSKARVKVKVSPLLQIRSFDLSVDGRLVYSE